MDPAKRIRIKKLLLAGNPYDAYLLEDAGFRLPGQIASSTTEPFQAPEFQLVRTGQEALAALQREKFDMILASQELPDMVGVELLQRIREWNPIFPAALYTSKPELAYTSDGQPVRGIRLFVYFGAPSFWRSLVTLFEDELNAPRLLASDEVLAILLVEDEPTFYSHFLPALYERIRRIAIEVLPEEKRPDSEWLTTENRPLVLLRTNFEDSVETLVRYQQRLMALITDVRFPVQGELRADAGLRLLYRARSLQSHLPVAVASREKHNEKAALEARAQFVWKDSPQLMLQLDNFLSDYCGFGPFTFRWPAGETYGVAKNIRELRNLIGDVPDVVFEHHALHHDFSTWISVHGHATLAKRIRNIKITENDVRATILAILDGDLAA